MNTFVLTLVFCIPGTFAACPPRVMVDQPNAMVIEHLTADTCIKLKDFYNDSHKAYASCVPEK